VSGRDVEADMVEAGAEVVAGRRPAPLEHRGHGEGLSMLVGRVSGCPACEAIAEREREERAAAAVACSACGASQGQCAFVQRLKFPACCAGCDHVGVG
jgi:hypothetical protein